MKDEPKGGEQWIRSNRWIVRGGYVERHEEIRHIR